jgi:3-hydroxyacyl-[acyl-carrier-protein] dehydratase
MFKDDLFIIKERQETETGCSYRLLLNASHPVYEAHFTGNPVTPGACIVRIIKELAEEFMNRPLHIDTVKKTKFLNTIHPVIHPEITVEIKLQTFENNTFSFSSTVFNKEITFAKSILYLK